MISGGLTWKRSPPRIEVIQKNTIQYPLLILTWSHIGIELFDDYSKCLSSQRPIWLGKVVEITKEITPLSDG